MEGVQHDRKLCPFYHNPRDRRRPPGTYSAEPCDESGTWRPLDFKSILVQSLNDFK